MKIVFVLLLYIVSISKVFASPVYLACEVKDEQGKIHNYDVTLDEQNRKITYNHKNSTAYNVEGFFSATEISFKHESSSNIPLILTTIYTIDRTNLSFTVMAMFSDKKFIQSGSCEIVNVIDRKI